MLFSGPLAKHILQLPLMVESLLNAMYTYFLTCPINQSLSPRVHKYYELLMHLNNTFPKLVIFTTAAHKILQL